MMKIDSALKRPVTILFSSLIPVCLLLLLSCGGGGGNGGSDERSVPNNLSASDIVIETDDPKIGYPLTVAVTLAADEATDNVSVSLFAIDDISDPEMAVRQIPLGTSTLARMDKGTRAYTFDVNIPSSIEFPGSYIIAAIIDPAEELAETDEDDNTATAEIMLSEGTPNPLLADLALDRAALLIKTDDYRHQVPPGAQGNVYNADAGGTITVGANGLGVDETIDIEAFATLRIIRSDNGTTYDVPLYLWNSDLARYTHAYGINPETGDAAGEAEWLLLGQFMPQLVERTGDDATLNDVDRDTAQLDFYIPGKLGRVLEYAMRYANTGGNQVNEALPTVPPPDLTFQAIEDLQWFLQSLPSSGIEGDETEAMAVMDFSICVAIRPADPAMGDFLPDDNERCAPIAIVLPAVDSAPPNQDMGGFESYFANPSHPLTSGDGFGTQGGGAAFGYSLDFGASATADYRGYIDALHGSLPVTIFASRIDFMSVAVRAQLVPDYAGKPEEEKSGYTVELRFLDQMLHTVDLPPGSPPKVSISFSKEVPGEDEKKVPKQYFIGPVPVDAGGSVAGNFGVEYEYGFMDPPELALGNQISPFANVDASLYAGVGSRLFSVGVEGVLTLLDERLEFFSGTTIDVLDSGFGSGIAQFIINQGQTITNAFTGPQGGLNLYAKYSVPKIVTCSWGFIKGKCITTKTIKATKSIWASRALFQKNDVLYDDQDVEFEVVVMNGQEPMYFVP